jgi:hypothetical protein
MGRELLRMVSEYQAFTLAPDGRTLATGAANTGRNEGVAAVFPLMVALQHEEYGPIWHASDKNLA